MTFQSKLPLQEKKTVDRKPFFKNQAGGHWEDCIWISRSINNKRLFSHCQTIETQTSGTKSINSQSKNFCQQLRFSIQVLMRKLKPLVKEKFQFEDREIS